MPEELFRTELAFFGVRSFTRFRVFRRSPYKNRKTSVCQHITPDRFRIEDLRRAHR